MEGLIMKKEFSKKIITALMVLFIINFEGVVIGSFILMIIFGDISAITEIIAGIFATLTAIITPAISFYFWKSKNENIIKLKKEFPEETKNLTINEPELNCSEIYEDETEEI